MILKLQRVREINNATIGELFVNDVFLCFTLEDKVRIEKIKHETAIPAGKYFIQNTYSPTFKKVLPLLLKVPNFSGIRIHPGNSIEDSSGCILVGTKVVNDKLIHSNAAFTKLFGLLQKAAKTESLEIHILDIPEPIVHQENPTIVNISIIEPQAQQTQTHSWKNNFWLNLLQQILNLLKRK